MEKEYVIKVCYKNTNDLPTTYHNVLNYFEEGDWLLIKFSTDEEKEGVVRIAKNYISRWIVFSN